MAKGKHTAFVLSPDVAASADGAHIPGIPGIWRHDEPITPDALGMGVKEFRDVISRLGLPLSEVQVADGESNDFFTRPTGYTHLTSEPEGESARRAGLDFDPVEDAVAAPDAETQDEQVADAHRQIVEDTLDDADALDEQQIDETTEGSK